MDWRERIVTNPDILVSQRKIEGAAVNRTDPRLVGASGRSVRLRSFPAPT